MKNTDNSRSDSKKHFFEVLQEKNDSEFKFFNYVEDAVREIIIFFFQVFVALGLMLFRPLHFGQTFSNFQENAKIPKPLTFLAFSAVIASLGFRRLIAIIQIWFCTSGILQIINFPEVQTPVWAKGIIFEFCRGTSESFVGLSKPDILSSLRQVSIPSMLFMAIPITLIALSFALGILSLFKPQKPKKCQQVVDTICYSAGYQLVVFAVSTLWFSEQIFSCIFRDPEQSFMECLGGSTVWFLLLVLYTVLAPVPILFSAVEKSSRTKQNLNQRSDAYLNRLVQESHDTRFIASLRKIIRNDKVKWFLKSILFSYFLFLKVLKKVLSILFFIILSIVILITELTVTVIVERIGLVESIGIRAIQRDEESNE